VLLQATWYALHTGATFLALCPFSFIIHLQRSLQKLPNRVSSAVLVLVGALSSFKFLATLNFKNDEQLAINTVM